jgi:hypothetical protein
MAPLAAAMACTLASGSTTVVSRADADDLAQFTRLPIVLAPSDSPLALMTREISR